MTSLRPAVPSDLDVVLSWMTSQEDCDHWSGGSVRYPVDKVGLPAAIQWEVIDNWVLVRHGHVTGFGQLTCKPDGRQHIGRVVVDPACRGIGLGRLLVTGLVNTALDSAPRCMSLNVHPANTPARRLYDSLGFHAVDDPVESRNGLYVYMERPVMVT